MNSASRDEPRKTSTVNLVVNRLTLIGLVCAILGAALIWHGYSQGELLVGVAIGVGGNLGSILASPRNPHEPQDVKVTNEKKDPVPTEQT